MSAPAASMMVRPEAQALIDKVHEARLDSPAMVSARTALHEELAKGVLAGKLHEARVEQRAKVLREATVAQRKNVARALNALHAELTPTERLQVMSGKYFASVWGRGPGPPPPSPRARLFRIAGELDLTAEQRSAMRTAMRAPDAGAPDAGALQQAAGDLMDLRKAFTSSEFDATAMKATRDASKRVMVAVEHEILTVRALLSVVTEAQRKPLADALRRK